MTALLELENIFLNFLSLKNSVLNAINYQVSKGDFVVILGSNGSGKSSLLKLIDRTYSATQGQIKLDGQSIGSYNHQQLARRVVTLTQEYHKSLFCSLTVLENCLLALERYKVELKTISKKNAKSFFAAYLAQYNPNLPKKFSTLTDDLSGGEKQALALALSVVHPPEILLLDEHTSALDPQTAQTLMSMTAHTIKSKNITCLMATHDLDMALQYGNKILVLQHGKILRHFSAGDKSSLTYQILLESCY